MHPNILFLFPDQHRPDWLGFNESLSIRTPNLESLAENGMRFTRAYTPSPLCAPARACLASGKQYPAHEIIDNRQPYPLDAPTYYKQLKDAGYHVAGVGKFDLDKPTLEWNLDGSRHLKEWGFNEGIDNEGKMDGSNSYLRKGKATGPYLNHLDQKGIAAQYCEEHKNCPNVNRCSAATFLDFAETKSLPDSAAKSLRPLLEGKTSQHRKVAVSALQDWQCAINDRYKLILQKDLSPILFDREDDPNEDQNIAEQKPEIVRELQQVLNGDINGDINE